MTVEELAKLPEDDLFYELDEGELISRPPGSAQHGCVGGELVMLIGNWVKQHSLGRTYAALAVEIFSPSDSVAQLMRKVRQYLAAGTHTIRVVYPETRQVHVFETGADRILGADANLEAPELLPGFSVRISELFE